MKEDEMNSGLFDKTDITDDDIYEAMKEISGFIDITPGDFKELYIRAYRHAVERLLTSVRAGDIMTRDVVYAKPETPLTEVARMMGSKGISGVPVVDESGNVIGVISERDFLANMEIEGVGNFMTLLAECLKGKGCLVVSMRRATAMDIMHSPAITVTEDTPVIEISRIFSEKNINRVPVVSSDGKLAGIVSRGDIVGGLRRR
jgi:CBS domain-containing protein